MIVQCPSGIAVTVSPVAFEVTRPSVGTDAAAVPLRHTDVYGGANDVSVELIVAPATATPLASCTCAVRG